MRAPLGIRVMRGHVGERIISRQREGGSRARIGSGRAAAAEQKKKPEATGGGPLLWLFCDCRRGQIIHLTVLESG